jgi:hypothetical protein
MPGRQKKSIQFVLGNLLKYIYIFTIYSNGTIFAEHYKIDSKFYEYI